MKVSIITVCFNSEETIRDTIESVLMQDYQDIEYIIVDGASKDKTMSIVNEYKNKISVIVSEPDKGIYDAMNKGVKLSSGDIVGILNSDDFFSSPTSISDLIKGFSSDVDGVYADLVYVERNNINKQVRLYSSAGFSIWKIRFGFMLPHPTFYVKRELFDKFGYYKNEYRAAADFELIARFLMRGVKLKRVDIRLVKMREGGVSTKDFRGRVSQNFEIMRACKENMIYTNIFMLMLKVPFKLVSYLAR